jgi:hypothetical protein
MIRIDKFGLEDEHQDLAYHLNGLIEADGEIKRLARTLNSVCGKNVRKTAEALSLLEFEIYEHLAYHLKGLRKPLSRLRTSAYKALEEQEGPSTEEEDLAWFQQLLSRRRADLEAKRVKQRAKVAAPNRKRGKPKQPHE